MSPPDGLEMSQIPRSVRGALGKSQGHAARQAKANIAPNVTSGRPGRLSKTVRPGCSNRDPAFFARVELLGGSMSATAGWMLVFSQFKQVLELPTSFFGYGSVGIRGAAGPMDGL